MRLDSREPRHPQADTRRVVCACTHYLVFKEPTRRPPLSRPGPLEPSSREPCDVTRPWEPCQPLSCRPTSFPEPAPHPTSFWGTLRIYQDRHPVSTRFSLAGEVSSGSCGTCFRRRQEMLRTFRSIGPSWSRWVTSEADNQYTRAPRNCQTGGTLGDSPHALRLTPYACPP